MVAGDTRPVSGQGNYRTPGVYYEEGVTKDGAPGLRTGVPAFVGFVESGAQHSENHAGCQYLTRWEQFGQHFGSAITGGFLDYAVRGFFENGGERCVVVPVRPDARSRSPSASALKEPFRRGGILEGLEDVDLLCLPDAMTQAIRTSRDAAVEIQSAALEHCERMGDRFAILDAFPVYGHAQFAGGRVDEEGLLKAVQHWEDLPPNNGALYFPWIYVKPLRRGQQSTVPATMHVADSADREALRLTKEVCVLVPPCGHIAGIYARTDAQVGVHKAPANEIVEGVLDLGVDLSDDEQGWLNEAGVNCLRSIPGRGIRVWGARTLSGQPNWRYVNVRRLFLTLTRWIEHNLNDLVFEPNNPSLWERARQRLSAYCFELFQRGALKGRSPDEGFFVKCDAETNPLEVREAGQIVAEIGLAPVMPAEFVIVHVTQSAAGVNVVNVPSRL